MFQLSGTVQYMFCINCGINQMIYTAENGQQFHVYFQTFHSKAKPVECFGPFAYSEPPSKLSEMITLYSVMSEIDEASIPADAREQAEETDIEQLSTISMNDLHYQPLHEILVDNILHGDVSLYMQ